MTEQEVPIHYVCTLAEAAELAEARKEFWVSTCGCRLARGQCARSRMDVCLTFVEEEPASTEGKKEISRADVHEILREAREKRLVPRPFRDQARTGTAGICFCCDDCCSYFLDPRERCDKGELIEETDLEECTDCGACVEVCHFGTRRMDGGELVIDRDRCFGCGLCVAECPIECVRMVSRE